MAGTVAADASARTRYATGISLYFATLFLVYGFHLPYFPVWLDWRGLGASDIAIITALPFFVRFLASPIIALSADHRSAHRTTIILLSWLAVAAAISLTQLTTFESIALAALILSLSKTSVMPMIETLAVTGVARMGLDYGRMRLWGSLTFIIASLLGGIIVDWYGGGTTIWLIVSACLLTAISAHFLIRPDAPSRPRNSNFEKRANQSANAQPPEPAITIRSAFTLLTKRNFLILLVATGAVQATHATYYTFGSLHWLNLGLSAVDVGILWGIGVVAEIAVFAKATPVLKRFGAEKLLLAGCIAAIIRWTLTATDPGFWPLVGLQVLHGLTFGASHLAAIHLVGRMVPSSLQGTGQALHASVGMGLAMGASMMLSGWLFSKFAGGAYLGMAALAVIATLAALSLQFYSEKKSDTQPSAP